jgi:hypothetical protein
VRQALIRIESFLRNSDGTFVSLGEVTNAPADTRHVEGAIELSIDDAVVLDKTLWDDVDQLWAYIGDMLVSLRKDAEASTYFPDQPIKLAFKRLARGRVLVTLQNRQDRRSVATDEREFVDALSRHARFFFERMSGLIPANRGGYEDAVLRFSQE